MDGLRAGEDDEGVRVGVRVHYQDDVLCGVQPLEDTPAVLLPARERGRPSQPVCPRVDGWWWLVSRARLQMPRKQCHGVTKRELRMRVPDEMRCRDPHETSGASTRSGCSFGDNAHSEFTAVMRSVCAISRTSALQEAEAENAVRRSE